MHQKISQAFDDYSIGNYENALIVVNEYLHENPNDTDANMLLAAIYAAYKDYLKVIDVCEHVLSYDSTNERAYYNAAIAYKVSGQIERSESCLKSMLSYYESHIPAILLLIEILLDKSDISSVEILYKKIVKFNISDTNILINLTRQFLNFKQYDLADRVLNKLKTLPLYNKDQENQIKRCQALVYYNSCQYVKSERLFQQNIKNNFQIAESYHYLGNIYEAQAKYQDAARCYLAVLQISPNSENTQYNLGLVYEKMGDHSRAFNTLVECDTAHNNTVNASLIRVIPQLKNDRFTDKVFDQIVMLINNKELDPLPLAQVAYDNLLYRHKHILGLVKSENKCDDFVKFNAVDVRELNQCDFLILYLGNISIINFEFEEFIRTLRFNILHQAANDYDLDYSHELCSALAIQCFMSGYVYIVNDNEQEMLDHLLHKIIENKLDWVRAVSYISVIAMYKSIHSFSEFLSSKFKVRADYVSYDNVLEQQYLNFIEEKNIKEKLIADTGISDNVSELVMKMYEDNPYPVWNRINVQRPKSISLIIKDVSPEYILPVSDITQPSVLIAGCGTGKHAILNAMRMESSEVTAIDLSLSSLAYAKRMAVKYGINRLNYQQLDVLNVSSLDMQFDVIESVGVLHHMNDTFAGLESLVSVLKTGGLINIGLYSSIGRRYVKIAKAKYHNNESFLSNDDLRKRRHSIASNSGVELKNNILSFSEFYKLNECRDLIFHEHEHNFNLQEIKVMLKKLNLEFVGFEFSDISVGQGYSKAYPLDNDKTNLQNWAEYEEANPDIFSSMYVFWCCKK